MGSPSHLAQEAIKFDGKLDFVMIPYKGTASALADAVGGHISAMVDALPSAMPHELVSKIQQEVAKALRSEQVAKSLGEHGFVVSGSTPDEFRTYIERESGKYGRLIKAANIKLENWTSNVTPVAVRAVPALPTRTPAASAFRLRWLVTARAQRRLATFSGTISGLARKSCGSAGSIVIRTQCVSGQPKVSTRVKFSNTRLVFAL